MLPEHSKLDRQSPSRLRALFVLPLLLLALPGLVGCDSTDNDETEVAQIIISPDSAEIAIGEAIDFSAVALSVSGDTIPNPDLTWVSTDEEVFSVAAGGIATGKETGTAFCRVEVQARLGFTGRDSAFVRVL